MSADEELRTNEDLALDNYQFVSSVSGKSVKLKGKSNGKLSSFGATGLITAMIVVAAVFFSSGNIIPSAISERLVEETDVQYADAVVSKELVFQQALRDGSIPNDTAERLKKKGIRVGYMNNEEFIETNQNTGGLSLMIDQKLIGADDFIKEIDNNIKLYDAFNDATYSRAAYYYDEAADKVFKKIGTTRNNFNGEDELEKVMDKLLKEGSEIDFNTVSLVEKTVTDEESGETSSFYEYVTNGDNIITDSASDALIVSVGEKNYAGSAEEATLNAADSLKAADTISKEQRSSLFYAIIMENISKMKAGDGNTSSINDAMNYLYRKAETKVVDVDTGEIITLKGAPLDSPSLYAILSGNKIERDSVKNFSSDRILILTENQLSSSNSSDVINGTIVSASTNTKGSIGRFIDNSGEGASLDVLKKSEPIITSSLIKNSFSDLNGINAGEFLVEGAINVGKELAKQSGASAGDESAILAYSRLNNTIIAKDAEVDRMKRSPFDMTSKNTFLGSIVYNLAIGMNSSKNKSILSSFGGVLKSVGKATLSLLPSTYADTTKGFLTNIGECKTIPNIGAAGSVGCSQTAVFDISTLNDPFNDAGFVDFVNQNTTLNAAGVREVNKDSVLADYILYNNERVTPIGIMDGGILDSLQKNSTSIGFMSSIINMIELLFNTSDDNKKIASGEMFVNSEKNNNWQTYKYAQRYVSLARATSVLKQYTNDEAAYNKMKFFEGKENPVMAFLDSYYNLANR